MPRTHAKLFCSVWDDPDWLGLSAPAQHCYQLLLSQKKLSLVGLLAYTPSRWARLSHDNSLASVEAAIRELEASASRFVVVDRETDELLIRTFVRHDVSNVTSNSNLVKGLWRAWEAIESRQLRHEVIHNIPDSIWEHPKVTPPAQAQTLRGQPPPNTQVRPDETDRSNQPLEPPVQTSLSPEPSSWVTSSAATEAPLDRAGANEAAAVDNSRRLTAEERQQRLADAVELLVDRELTRNPTRRSSVERHRTAVRKGKLKDHHQAGHRALAENPNLTPDRLADLLEPPSAPASYHPELGRRAVPDEAATRRHLDELASYEPPPPEPVKEALATAWQYVRHPHAKEHT